MGFLSLLTGSFSTPAAENPTVAMVEAAFRDLGLDARYLNCEVAPDAAGRRRPRRPGDGLEGLQLLDPAQGDRDRASRRAGRIGGADRRGQLRRRARRPLDRREHRRHRASSRRCARSSSRRAADSCCSAPAARRGRSGRAALAGVRSITVVNRDRARGAELAALISGRTPAAVRAVGRASRARVGRTSWSTRRRSGCSRTSARRCRLCEPVAPGMVVADVIPNPPRTRLSARRRRAGATVLDGIGMLVEQGVIGIRLWTGRAGRGGDAPDRRGAAGRLARSAPRKPRIQVVPEPDLVLAIDPAHTDLAPVPPRPGSRSARCPDRAARSRPVERARCRSGVRRTPP